MPKRCTLCCQTLSKDGTHQEIITFFTQRDLKKYLRKNGCSFSDSYFSNFGEGEELVFKTSTRTFKVQESKETRIERRHKI